MEPQERFGVSEWTAAAVESARQTSPPGDCRAWIPRAIGGAAVLAVHFLLVLSLHAATAAMPSNSGMVDGSLGDAALIVTIIDEPLRADELSPDGVRPVLLPPISMPLAIQSPPELRDHLTLGEENSPEGRADQTLSAASEIYDRQISARVSRLWEHPSPVQGFECTVQLEQDADGFVKEVLLQKCNGSDAWRQSLLTAIWSASPLPAPPDRRVFRPSLVLAFAATPDVPGQPASD